MRSVTQQDLSSFKKITKRWILNGSHLVVAFDDHFRLFNLNSLPNAVKEHIKSSDATPFINPHHLSTKDQAAYQSVCSAIASPRQWKKVPYTQLMKMMLIEKCPVTLDMYTFDNAILVRSMRYLSDTKKQSGNETWYLMSERNYADDDSESSTVDYLRSIDYDSPPLIDSMKNCLILQNTPYRWWIKLKDLDKTILARLIDFSQSTFESDEIRLHLHRGKLAHDPDFFFRLRLNNRNQWHPHPDYASVLPIHQSQSREYFERQNNQGNRVAHAVMQEIPLDGLEFKLSLLNVTLIDSSIVHAKLLSIRWKHVQLHYTKLSNSLISDSSLKATKCYMSAINEAILINSNLTQTLFYDCNLSSTTIIGSTIDECKFHYGKADNLRLDSNTLQNVAFKKMKGNGTKLFSNRVYPTNCVSSHK